MTEQAEGSVVQKEKKFDFYRINTPGADDPLAQFFARSIDEGKNPDQKIQDDHYIQIQELDYLVADTARMVHGIVKKFIPKKESPVIGKVGETKERPISMDEDESLVEKTFFLYNVSRGVFLYQRNRDGTTAKKTGQYLSVLCGKTVVFEPVLTPDAYTILQNDGAVVKKIIVNVARPTNAEVIRTSKNKWTSRQMEFLRDMNGVRLKLEMKIEPSGSGAAWSFVKDLMNTYKDESKGKVCVVDEDNVEHLIDLVADRMSATAEVPMSGKYPVTEDMLRIMRDIMLDAEPKLKSIFGPGG